MNLVTLLKDAHMILNGVHIKAITKRPCTIVVGGRQSDIF